MKKLFNKNFKRSSTGKISSTSCLILRTIKLFFFIVFVLSFSIFQSFNHQSSIQLAHAQSASSQFTTSLTTFGTDMIPPSVPTGLTAMPASQSEIDLSWNASTDNFAVRGYVLFRDGNAIATTSAVTTDFADTLLAASTTYTYAVQAFDNSYNYSALSATSSTTTLPVPVIPPTPTSTPAVGQGGGSSAGSSLIYDVNITVDSGNAVVSFLTTLPSQSTVSYGLTPDYEAGSVSGVISETSHQVDLSGLSPETHYYVLITANAVEGAQSSYIAEFTTAGLPGAPLPNPSGFSARPTTNAIDLSWTNTTDPRATGVRVVRSDTFFPSDQFDGMPVYEGLGQSFVDTSATAGETYYYAIFSEGNSSTGEKIFSSGSLLRSRIALPGETVSFATSTNPFAGITFATTTNPIIAGLTLADFQFIQENKQLGIAGNNIIGVNGEENMTVRLPYDKVPQILKTIAVTLNDPSDPSKAFIFLLRANADKTYYEASIGPLGRTGIFPLTVTILDYQNQGLKQLSGSLAALVIGAYPTAMRGFDQMWFWLGPIILIALLIGVLLWNKKKKAEKLKSGSKDSRFQVNDKKSLVSSSIVILFAAVSVFSIFGLQSAIAHASFNPEINYQGKLANSSNVTVADGQYPIIFNLYTSATGGSPVWTETDYGANQATVKNGLFSIMLGSTTPFTGIDFNQTLYLGVTVASDTEMTPRKIIGAVPAAFYSATSTYATSAGTSTSALNAATSTNSLSAQTLQNITPGQFFRNDQQNATSSADTFLNVLQSGAGKVAEFFGSASQSVLAILSNGNVGIGTTSPSNRLEVSGNTFLGGNVTATGTLEVTGATTLSSTLNVTGATTLATSLNGFLQATNGLVSATTSPSINALSGILGVSNGGTGQSSFTDGQLLIGNSTGNTLTPATLTGTTNEINITNGNGSITLSTPQAIDSTAKPTFASTTLSNFTAGSIPFFTTGGSLNQDNSNLFWDSTNKRLGVGTSTPWAAVSIQGSLSTPYSDQIFSVASSSGSSIFSVLGNGDVNIAPSTVPTFASSTKVGLSTPNYTFIAGNYAYVTDSGNSSLVIFDISSPAAPLKIGSSNTGLSSPDSVYVSGRYAYVASYANNSLVIFDISNPAVPREVSSISSGLQGPYYIYASGHYVYMADNNGLFIFDVSNPSAPTKAGFVTVSSPTSVYASGRYAYVTGSNALVVVDVSNPVSPVQVGSSTVGLNQAYDVYVSGRYAYVADWGNNALVIFDISNPAVPTEVNSINTGLSEAFAVSVSGRYAYVSSYGNNSIVTFDISNPAVPSEVSSATAGLSKPVSFSVSGHYAYVSSSGNGSLVTFDLGGAEFNSENVGSLRTGNLQVSNDIVAQGELQVAGGLNVGAGGIFTSGPLSVSVASSTQANAISAYFRGLVGIGTTSPSSLLGIQGTSSAATTDLFSVASSTGASIFKILSNGNIGIGTSSPSNALEVFGNGYFSGNLAGANLTATGSTTLASSLNGFLQATNGLVTSTTSPSINALSGVLGVLNGGTGTSTAPGLNQLLVGNGSGGYNYVGTSSLGISATPAGLSGQIQFNNGGSFGASSTLTWDNVLGNLTANYFTATSTTATSTFAGNLSVGGNLNFNGTFLQNGSPFVGSQWTKSGSNIYYNSGNVGIGTTTPSAELSIHDSSGLAGTNPIFTIASSTSAGLSTTTLLTVLGNGNVGINTTNPAYTLDVKGVINASGNIYSSGSIDLQPGGHYLYTYGRSAAGSGAILFNSGTTYNLSLNELSNGNYAIGSSSGAGNAVKPTLIMNINKGYVGIGTTTPATALDVNGDITNENVKACNGGSGGLATDSTGKEYCQVAFSDARLKGDVTSLDPQNALSIVNSLNPVSFYWKDPSIPGTNSTQEQFGFIAQDVVKVAPNLVATTSPTYLTPDGTYYLNYQGVIPLLAKAIQAQQMQISLATSSISTLSVNQDVFASSTTVTLASLSDQVNALGTQFSVLSASTTEMQTSITNLRAALASNSIVLSSMTPSSTAAILTTSTSFIQLTASAVQNIIQSTGNWVIAKLTAMQIYTTDIQTKTLEAQTASVTNGLEMTDSATGQIYCVRITNGNFDKMLGACSAIATTTTTLTASNGQAQNNNQTSSVGTTTDTAYSTTSEAYGATSTTTLTASTTSAILTNTAQTTSTSSSSTSSSLASSTSSDSNSNDSAVTAPPSSTSIPTSPSTATPTTPSASSDSSGLLNVPSSDSSSSVPAQTSDVSATMSSSSSPATSPTN